MAKKTLYVSLGKSRGSNAISVQDCIKELEKYKQELNVKAKEFIDKLAELGITVASANGGYYQGYIAFSKVDESNGDELSIVINAHDITKIESRWWHDGKLVSNEISPVLMAEFGAGWLADVSEYEVSVPGGRGTNSPYGHAFDDGWHWTTEDGTIHYIGETPQYISDKAVIVSPEEMTPSHPMFHAIEAMRNSINSIAKEVFG